MADVERKAEAEAQKKGLSGQAEKNYVGGVFNRIRAAHDRATTPGKGKRHLNRAAARIGKPAAKAATPPQAPTRAQPAAQARPAEQFGRNFGVLRYGCDWAH